MDSWRVHVSSRCRKWETSPLPKTMKSPREHRECCVSKWQMGTPPVLDWSLNICPKSGRFFFFVQKSRCSLVYLFEKSTSINISVRKVTIAIEIRFKCVYVLFFISKVVWFITICGSMVCIFLSQDKMSLRHRVYMKAEVSLWIHVYFLFFSIKLNDKITMNC